METKRLPTTGANDSDRYGAEDQHPSLTQRERQVLTLLAGGRSGAQIAAELVLSPETVRTHIRHAMSKLGATTRAHAVALALQRGDIGAGPVDASAERRSRPDHSSAETSAALQRMIDGLATLYDVDGGGVYLSREDGLSIRLVAVTETLGFELPVLVALGDGTLGRAALHRRSQFCQEDVGHSHDTLIAVPIMADGRLVGVIALCARVSRPIMRTELLLLQAFSNRVGEVLEKGGEVADPLVGAMEHLRASWSAAGRVR